MLVSTTDIRKNNRHQVLWALYDKGPSTVREIMKTTGLSFSTVNLLTVELVSDLEIVEDKRIASNGGRPSQVYRFEERKASFLLISLYLTSNYTTITHYEVVDLKGHVIHKQVVERQEISADMIGQEINTYLNNFQEIVCVGLVAPGVVQSSRFVKNDIAALVDIDFSEHINVKRTIHLLAENDVNAAIYGATDLSKPANTVGIYFPKVDNPGAGLIVDSHIIRGANGFAGEVADLPLGVDWVKLDYTNRKEVVQSVSKLIAVFKLILDPEKILLYGDFLDEDMLDLVLKTSAIDLMKDVELHHKQSLVDDSLSGMFKICLDWYRAK